ncbi:MAG: hypothetical protein D6807_02995 [Alphaproteobacteria bacterium]|nr:MAG: hypothetical protein D6807_02995 [Alphaproteobacteria bacterium]
MKFAIIGFVLIAAALQPFQASAGAAPAYRVQFPTSCDAGVKEPFEEAVTFLHSFEYPKVYKAFEAISSADPDCAMAYWGMAMSIWHPVWAPPSAVELAQGAAILARTDGLAVSPREAAYIEALKAFFSSTDTGTHLARARAYEARMSALAAAYRDDPEAAAFYSLALLATADPRDKTYAHQYKAAAQLNWVRQSQPEHPGAAHYLIHSFDYPGLAHLALDAATSYAVVAPNSTHAHHMPSHIFTRLGLWEESLASNHNAVRSAVDFTRRNKLSGFYKEGVHGMDYLMYAMLQTARDDEAAALLARLRKIGKTDNDNFFAVAYTYAAAPARHALERRQWVEARELALLPTDFPWENFVWARAMHHFARGIGAARSGAVDQARQEHGRILALEGELPAETLPYLRESVAVQREAVESWILHSTNKVDEALRLAAHAADREDAVDKHPVTPGEILPARELYADMLLESTAHEEALAQYQLVLAGAPGRLNAMLGAARAAGALGDPALAASYHAQIRAQTRPGDRHRRGLAEAWEAAP